MPFHFHSSGERAPLLHSHSGAGWNMNVNLKPGEELTALHTKTQKDTETYSAHQIQSCFPPPPLHLWARLSLHHPPTDRHVTDQGSSPVSHPVQSSLLMTKAYLPQISRSHWAVWGRKYERWVDAGEKSNNWRGFAQKWTQELRSTDSKNTDYSDVNVQKPVVLKQLTELGPVKRSDPLQ